MARYACFVIAIVLASTIARAQSSDSYIWIEGESPTSVVPAGFGFKPANGSPKILSDDKWLTLNIDAGKVESSLPDTGAEVHYAFQSSKTTDYKLWLRLGYETSRPAMDWQIDHGDWQPIDREARTIDVQELGVWAPVAWLNLGKQSLAAGQHEIALRIRKEQNKAGKYDNVLFGLDAICIASGPFHPDGPIKPGDTRWMTDADKAAADSTFTVSTNNKRISLRGQWQYAGDDEPEPQDRLGPTASLPDPSSLTWHSINVPGDRNREIPTERYVHRFYLHTRLIIAAELDGDSFVLHLPDQNMIATVFVNGLRCGFTKAPGAPWDCDITKAVKPGNPNDLTVAIKDAFYGLDEKPTTHLKYTPYEFWHFNLTQSLDMPELSHYHAGIVRLAPTLTVAGPVYVSDVFAKPSVKNKSLDLEITLHNPGVTPIDVAVTNEVQPLAGGTAAKSFAPVSKIVPAGQDLTFQLSEAWNNPKLWWPDDPQQYNVVTKLTIGGKATDELKTKFGFREWSWDGPDFKLNGIPWHGFADNFTTDIPTLKKHGQTMVRVWGMDDNTEKYIDECDAQGMCVRRTGIFDGEGAGGFYAISNPALWDNYRQQMFPWIRAQRNHPSIFIWSIENEITFINGHVTGQDKITTREIKKSYDLFKQVDPTRPYMTDGGNALLDESMPIYGGHYMEPDYSTLPEATYDKAGYEHRQVWPITQAKPRLFGEAAYLSGNTPAELAAVGGEEAAIGPAESRPARTTILRMLSEGYRWTGINFHYWTTNEGDFYNAWAPTALLCRQWDWTFGSGQTVTRTLGIFNDTRSTSPITFTSSLSVGGQNGTSESSIHAIAPGENEKFDVKLKVPTFSSRQEGLWALTLARDGKVIFTETKSISVLPSIAEAKSSETIAIFDPTGNTRSFLIGAGITVSSILNLREIPPSAKVLIIGSNALDEQAATSSQLSAWASSGKAVIVLEQRNPLKFQAIPGEMETDENHGCLAFAEDPTHPIFDGLAQKDFSCWGNDSWTYRNAYVKPTSGGKSLIQCGNLLHDCALAQMQAGKGIMLLSQLLVGEKIRENAVAQRLLINMIHYAQGYKLTYRETSVVASSNPDLMKALNATGLQYETPADVMGALAKPGGVAVIDACPANLAMLTSNFAQVNAFTQAGGWIILNRLTPEGIVDFNKLVGVDHLIRPFRAEKITWALHRNPLTAGLPAANVVLGTGKKIMWFASPEFPDPNAYSYVVDLDDVAPFAKSTYGGWNNAVNGFTQKDGAWQLIQNLPPKAAVMPITLARPEKIQQIVWCSDNNYEGCKRIEVEINGRIYPFDTEPNGDEQTFSILDEPTASQLTIRIADWEHNPDKTHDREELVGIDNIRIKVARRADFFDRVKPMLNIGAIVEYPKGKGGIVLCNINFRSSEENPENTGKKRTVIATLLGNLQAKFHGGSALIAGANLQFTPIDISKSCNQYRGEQGWFGDKLHTFEALPPGRQVMAGVTYDIYHFTTSIVPEAIMLQGNGVTGISVNKKAEALFFLQAAHIDAKMNNDDRKKGKRYLVADYIVHYADETTEMIPVYAEISVDDYHQKSPTAIPGAQIGWQQSYGPSDGFAVAYSMQWNNPHPDLEITSLDLIRGPDHRGTPVLLALSAANSR